MHVDVQQESQIYFHYKGNILNVTHIASSLNGDGNGDGERCHYKLPYKDTFLYGDC